MFLRKGTCELCGAEDQELSVLVIGDFAGRACPECVAELRECQPRRYCSAGEETEPGE